MRKIKDALMMTGLLVIMLFGSAMDSECQLIPVIGLVVGFLMILAGLQSKEKWPA